MVQLELLLTGIAVVLMVLVAVWCACVIMGRAFRESSSADVVTSAKEPSPHEGIPAQHIAAITGAVAVMTSRSYRALNVSAPVLSAKAWVKSTRLQQVRNHRVRWDWTVQENPKAHTSMNAANPDSSHKDQDSSVNAKIRPS